MPAPTRSARRARGLALAFVLALVAGCTGGGATQRETDSGEAAARAFLTDWQAGEDQQASTRTDRPAAARAGLAGLRDGLRVSALHVTPGQFTPGSGSAPPELTYRVALHLASLGDWSYDGRLSLVHPPAGASGPSAAPARPTGGWVVHWAPSLLHPQVTATTRLERVRELPPRAPVLDRHGTALMRERPVVDIGIEPRALRNPDQAYAVLADTLDIDPQALRARVDKAPPTQLVAVITLRRAAYGAIAGRLRGLVGLRFAGHTLSLAATPTFGRALLGRVAPASAQTLRNAGLEASPADAVGESGLQYAFQRRLAGTAGGAVRLVDRTTGRVRETLQRFAATPGQPLHTTLDAHLQQAAEQALATRPEPTALVAVRPSTGEILAVADGPAGAAYDRAVLGLYPPGSTFKVVTAAALLADGLRPSDTVPCSATVVAGGRRFENYDGLGALGPIPFRRAFAESCNTAFIAASKRLGRWALTRQAPAFGVGGWRLPVPANAGSVPPVVSAVEQAADAIGQGRVSMSPLGMAVVAATAQAGVFRAPTLVAGAPAAEGTPLDAGVVKDLQAMMRETVTAGTAEVLDLPGVPVAAKTGTAEYGTTSPPRTHAWMIGYRGDLAFAVLVEGGGTGGADAGPVARRFLQAAG